MRILVVHNHIVLPLAIVFGIASGVTPQQGLITAIIAGFIIAIFGGSRYLIGGPTGAFIVVIAGIIAKFGMTGLTIATIMAGVMLVVMGLCRIIRMRKVPFIDSTGVKNLRHLCDMARQRGLQVVLSGVQPEVMSTLEKFGLDKELGREHIFDNIVPALAYANDLADKAGKSE